MSKRRRGQPKLSSGVRESVCAKERRKAASVVHFQEKMYWFECRGEKEGGDGRTKKEKDIVKRR